MHNFVVQNKKQNSHNKPDLMKNTTSLCKRNTVAIKNIFLIALLKYLCVLEIVSKFRF